MITISGKPGSGKSTVAKLLAARLGVEHLSSGDFMRQLAAERGLSVLELSRQAESDPTIDRAVDERSARLGSSGRSFVMDSRLAWRFVPGSVKVFLDVALDEAAARVYRDADRREHENVDHEATLEALRDRMDSEAQRYRDYYGVDYLDPTHYDLVVDTTDLSPEQTVEEIERHLARV